MGSYILNIYVIFQFIRELLSKPDIKYQKESKIAIYFVHYFKKKKMNTEYIYVYLE